MTPSQISRLIEEDLDRNGRSLSWQGRPLQECLCEPGKIRVLDASHKNEFLEVWPLFEERASAPEGYKIVYSEEDGEFALASPGQRPRIASKVSGTGTGTAG
jgi:hypothetical protein